MLLSIGTGQSPAYIAGKRHDWGYVQWAKPLARLIIEGAMDTARYQCQQILTDRYRRIDVLLDRPIALDGVKHVPELVQAGEDVPLDRAGPGGTSAIAWVATHFLDR